MYALAEINYVMTKLISGEIRFHFNLKLSYYVKFRRIITSFHHMYLLKVYVFVNIKLITMFLCVMLFVYGIIITFTIINSLIRGESLGPRQYYLYKFNCSRPVYMLETLSSKMLYGIHDHILKFS